MFDEQKKRVDDMKLKLYTLELEVKKTRFQLKEQEEILIDLCNERGHVFDKKDSGDYHSSYYYKVCKHCGYYK